MKKSLTFIALFFSIAILSNSIAQERSITGNWVLTGAVVKGKKLSSENMMINNWFLNFHQDGSYTETRPGNDKHTGDWKYGDSKNIILMKEEGQEKWEQSKISTLTDTELVLHNEGRDMKMEFKAVE